MKTLIFNGSPRENGDTADLIRLFVDNMPGECRIVNAYRCNISPCVDCRYCRSNSGCAIEDEMQRVYDYIRECDNILIASPIYFSELTGRLLDVGSRLQMYFCARFFRGEDLTGKVKRGAVALVGGGDGSMQKAFDTAKTLLHHMNCGDVHPLVFSHRTEELPAIRDEHALEGIYSIVDYFNMINET